jgi:heme-degrading monooxygenase HmoA
MFIAMNRFRVVKGSEDAFENVWLSRDSHLHTVPGFVEFRLRSGGRRSHTVCLPHRMGVSCHFMLPGFSKA